MKARSSRLGVALLASLALLSIACGFDTRSGQFECANDNDCESYQRCADGQCLLAGRQCHPDCDECGAGVCIMRCEGEGACRSEVVCPPSQICRVVCSGAGACGGGVDCTDATTCVVACLSADTCAGPIDCGTSDCTVSCLAGGSCAGGVDCSDACACETNCDVNGTRTCVPECPQGNSCASGPNCTSDGNGCDTCES